MNRREVLTTGAAAIVSATGIGAAGAQSSFPTAPISLIVPFPAGGVNDTVARPLVEKIRSHLGTMIVVNIGGAGGAIGANKASRATPDGYTLLLGSGATHIVTPIASVNPPYDPEKAFDAISIIQVSGIGIAVHPSHPAKTLKELIAYAHANPGKLSYGSAGVGSATHLGAELFKSLTKTDILHVPYRGGAAALNDLIAGHVPVGMVNISAQALELHRTGKLRLLAATTEKRPIGAPFLPTAQEAGVPGCVAINFSGLFAPAGTPRPIIDRISAATAAVMKDKQFIDILIASGLEPYHDQSPEAARRFVRQELERWTPVIKQIGLKLK